MYEIQVFPVAGFREPFCSLSHTVGACVFAVFAWFLIRRGRGNWARVVSLTLMALSTIQLLLLSSAYHMLWPGPMRNLMLRADVAGIFVLIAGCITPVHVILFRGPARWVPLMLFWTVALLGLFLRILFFDHLPGNAGVGIFLLFGWATAFTAAALWWNFGWKFVCQGVLAGIAYSVGAVVLVLNSPVLIPGVIGPHELWHLLVLTGLGLHWSFVFKFASGDVPAYRPVLVHRRTTREAVTRAAYARGYLAENWSTSLGMITGVGEQPASEAGLSGE
jgi:channel protein (hemolysin III family)